MFKHILLPTDGSGLSLGAVDQGIALAAALGADVHAFHVVAPFSAFSYMVGLTDLNQDAWFDDGVERATTYLADVQMRAEQAGVPCSGSYVTDAHPHQAIIAAAETHGCDLIVMASHGWRGMNRLLLGSETQKVLLSCAIPVLVCR